VDLNQVQRPSRNEDHNLGRRPSPSVVLNLDPRHSRSLVQGPSRVVVRAATQVEVEEIVREKANVTDK
jgi:hypothetical protein